MLTGCKDIYIQQQVMNEGQKDAGRCRKRTGKAQLLESPSYFTTSITSSHVTKNQEPHLFPLKIQLIQIAFCDKVNEHLVTFVSSL